jgi:hypothetical protein
MEFSEKVLDHIENYVVPQYGDLPDKFLEIMTEDDMIHDVERYIRRMKSNVRGVSESKRDLLKIAHYMNLIFLKRVENYDKQLA